jgi:NADH:ubiquinone oxidoreductase subunit 5 (subunit L)/multisubunit Na+/H+ antiporter MnhA subunit
MAAVIAVSFKFHHEMKALTGTFFYVYMTVRGISLVFGGFISETDLVAGALSNTLEPSLTLAFILYCVAIVLGTAGLFYFFYEKNEYVPQVDEPKKKDLGFPTPQKSSTNDNEVYNY